MKKFLAIAAGLVVACVALAGPNRYKFNAFSTIATNGATSGIVTNESVSLSGYVDEIIIDISGTATNVDVDLRTKPSNGSGPARTILSTNDMTADIVVYPRVVTLNTTAGASAALEYTRIPLDSDVIQCWFQAETTGVTAVVYVTLSPTP